MNEPQPNVSSDSLPATPLPAESRSRAFQSTFGQPVRSQFSRIRTYARRTLWDISDSWHRLTDGLEIDALWLQFKSEAHESTRLYRQDAALHSASSTYTWKRPFRIFAALFRAILYKLSPARRVFLLAILVLASLSLAGIEFLLITRQVEFLTAFLSLLILLTMVLGDHVTMKRDIEIAREIQRWLVPRVPPDVPGIDMAFATRPAQTVAGDYYDAFRRAIDGPLLLAVADVSGKSVPAAMLMANFQASLRALAGSPGPLSDLVTNLNRLVCASNSNGRRFTTAFLAELDPATGELTYLSAGHNPPILLREDGTIERLQSESIPLGIETAEKFPTNSTYLHRNDLLLIYTDGVPEARSSSGHEFGETRLLSTIQPNLQERAAVTLATIMTKLDEFVGPASQHDDITCLVVRRT